MLKVVLSKSFKFQVPSFKLRETWNLGTCNLELGTWNLKLFEI